MAKRPGLRFRFALFFAALAIGGTLVAGLGLWLGHARGGGSTESYLIAGLVAAFGLAGLAAWIGFLFDENVAKPILSLSADLVTRARSDVSHDLDTESARHLDELADAARTVQTALAEARASLEQVLAEQTARIARDKALLEALLRELADGVVVVSSDGRILLYNRAAAILLGSLGLDRPLSRYLRTDPVMAAIDRLTTKAGSGGAATFLTSPTSGSQIFTGTVSAVEFEGDLIGHVLHFRDMTEDLRVHGDLERLLTRTIEGARRPISAIGAVLDTLEVAPDLPPEDRARFEASLREERDRLAEVLAKSAAEEAAINAMHWPIRTLDVQQIFDVLQQQMQQAVTISATDAIARCDGFAVTEILARILRELSDRAGYDGLTLSAEQTAGEVRLLLSWQGGTLPLGDLEAWLSDPVAVAYGDYSGREALAAHRSDIWVEPAEAGARIVLPLRAASAIESRSAAEPLGFYDFDLPSHAGTELGSRPLADLAYTVFDTETTGLNTDRDAVVQIAGIRIVGNRPRYEETFDRLVNPGRAIPLATTKIHGIDDAMVADAPPFIDVAGTFLDFAEGSVLIAHHAAFDMAFLNRAAQQAGATLTVPVLCTALLSSRLFQHSGDHTLDGLAARCGIDIESELRHTALGDSIATAEVFLKLIPLLEAAGIKTLDDALAWQSGGG